MGAFQSRFHYPYYSLVSASIENFESRIASGVPLIPQWNENVYFKLPNIFCGYVFLQPYLTALGNLAEPEIPGLVRLIMVNNS